MAFTDYGAKKAAAYRVDFQGMIRNAVEQEQLTNAALQQRKEEVRYYSDKMKTGSSDIASIQAKLDEFNKGKVNEIGKFVAENPDFELDINKNAEFNNMTGSLLNNDLLREGEVSKQNYAAFQEAFQQGTLTNDEFVEYSKSWENYKESGGGQGTPWQFNNPKRFSAADLSAVGQVMVKPKLRDPETRNGMMGQERYIDPVEATDAAIQVANDPLYKASVDLMYKGMAGMYTSPEDMLFHMFKNQDDLGFEASGIDPFYSKQAQYQMEARYDSSTGADAPTPMYTRTIAAALNEGRNSSRYEELANLTDLGPVDSEFVMNNPSIAISMQNDDGSFTPLTGFNYSAKVAGGGYAFRHNGSDFATIDVEVSAPADEDVMRKMKNAGFTPNFTRVESSMGQFQYITNGKTTKNPTYTGTVVTPLVRTPAKLYQFDKDIGVGEATTRKMSNAYETITQLSPRGADYPTALTGKTNDVTVPETKAPDKSNVRITRVGTRKERKAYKEELSKRGSEQYGSYKRALTPSEEIQIREFISSPNNIYFYGLDGSDKDWDKAVDALINAGRITKD